MTKHDWKVGDRAIISARTDGALSSLLIGSHVEICELDGKRYGVKFSTGFVMYLDAIDLEPLPTETPKDPFAPGEYVTCVANPNNWYLRQAGDTAIVTKPDHGTPPGWFSYHIPGDSGYQAPRDTFRPATPEEIAAYKAKYEVEPGHTFASLLEECLQEDGLLDPKPKTYTLTPYIKPETIMLHGVEYLVTENV